jgi:ubiquinone/menaquinone biosynthesis C-methylase UbiE
MCVTSMPMDTKTPAVANLIRQRFGTPQRLLVVGCGPGLEAAHLAEELGSTVTGIDVADTFDDEARRRVDLRVGDGTALDFEDDTFDFVYCYHVLEHIPLYAIALSEMRRAMRPGAGYWIGTPNRRRLVGYIGSEGTSLAKKLAWNGADWKARLKGQFRNELGAHAGFTSQELRRILVSAFGNAEETTREYYRAVYGSHGRALTVIERSGLGRLLYPAVYFVGTA